MGKQLRSTLLSIAGLGAVVFLVTLALERAMEEVYVIAWGSSEWISPCVAIVPPMVVAVSASVAGLLSRLLTLPKGAAVASIAAGLLCYIHLMGERDLMLFGTGWVYVNASGIGAARTLASFLAVVPSAALGILLSTSLYRSGQLDKAHTLVTAAVVLITGLTLCMLVYVPVLYAERNEHIIMYEDKQRIQGELAFYMNKLSDLGYPPQDLGAPQQIGGPEPGEP